MYALVAQEQTNIFKNIRVEALNKKNFQALFVSPIWRK